ncbi:hypothetical protein K8I61_17335 [bacterium]|nr:hypothetical protein [bacterium]
MTTGNVEVLPVELLETKASRRFSARTDSATVYPKTWHEEAFKAADHYRKAGYPRSIVNAFITLAFGDAIFAQKVVDESGEDLGEDRLKEVNGAIRKKKVLSHLKQQIQQLLVKGDLVGFWESDRDMARVVNPIGIEPKYEKGELKSAIQLPVDKKGKARTGGLGESLDIEGLFHARWDAAEFEAHGNSMLLPAFEEIELLGDLRAADRAIAKRWANPILIARAGGMFGNKLIHCTQDMLDDMAKNIDESDKRSTLIWPYYYDAKLLGTEGEVLDTDTRKKSAQEAIAVAMGFPRTLLTGDGATFSTAQVASEKLALTLDAIREYAWAYLDWLFGFLVRGATVEWGHRGFSQFSTTAFKEMVGKLHEQGIISRRTAQTWLAINPDEEAAQAAQDEIRVRPTMSVQDIIGLVSTGVITPQDAAEMLGFDPGKATGSATQDPATVAGRANNGVPPNDKAA